MSILYSGSPNSLTPGSLPAGVLKIFETNGIAIRHVLDRTHSAIAPLPPLKPDGNGQGKTGETYRARAWALAQAYNANRRDLLIVEGFHIARTLAGNKQMQGKYWVILDDDDMHAFAEGLFSANYVHQALMPAHLVIVSAESSSVLLERFPELAGKVCAANNVGTVSGASIDRLSASLSLLSRYKCFSAEGTIIVEGIRLENNGEIDVEYAAGSDIRVFPLQPSDGPVDHKLSPTEIQDGENNNISLEIVGADLPIKNVAWQLRRLLEDLNGGILIVGSGTLIDYCLGHDVMKESTWIWVDDNNFSEVVRTNWGGRRRAKRFVVSTEELRSRLEVFSPDIAGNVSVLQDILTIAAKGSEDVQPVDVSRYLNFKPEYVSAYSESGMDRFNVVIAGHDFKFVEEINGTLSRLPKLSLRYDTWPKQHLQDRIQSEELIKWADIVWCEFASRNAVWYSNNKRVGQRIVVRVHGYELLGPWMSGMQYEAVDLWVFVSENLRDQALAEFDLDPSRTVVLPNTVDVLDLGRAKFPMANYHLGIAGIVPAIKRPDRALDLLEMLLEEDERYVLHIRGRRPFDYDWVWQNSGSRASYDAFYERLAMSPKVRSRVSFDAFGPDMGRWFRKVGWILSPSTRESFHLAPIEGMASGAVPVVWSRTGASEVFPSESIVSDTEAAARLIQEGNASLSNFKFASEKARDYALQFDTRHHQQAILAAVFGS